MNKKEETKKGVYFKFYPSDKKKWQKRAKKLKLPLTNYFEKLANKDCEDEHAKHLGI